MGWMVTALAVAVITALAHHLGLVGKVVEVVSEVAACQRCSVFWTVLVVMILSGAPALQSALAALPLAYLCDWLGLAFYKLAEIYDRLWKRIAERSPQRGTERSQDRHQ